MTADVTRIYPEPLIPGCTHAEIDRLTRQYEAELAMVSDDARPTPDIPLPSADPEKEFKTRQAKFALAGWSLVRSNPADGAQCFFAARWGRPHMLADLAEVDRFAEQVGVR